MIDTHTHIYLQEFDEDRRAVIDRAEKSGITRMILPNVDVETVGALRQTLNDCSSLCKGAMGLHPTSINQDYKRDLSCIEAELDRGEYCAVGEIGMDLYWDKTFLREQIDAFTSQVRWSCNKKIPVIIHCRDAFDETVAALKSLSSLSLTGVFHSFGGTPDQVKIIRELGDFYFGINGVVTFKNARLDETIREIGVDRVLLETDAPYLAPVPFRGKRNEPSYIVKNAEKIAEILGLSNQEVEERTSRNAEILFKL